MRKTLLQTLLAAFSCILAHASLEGGGVMLIGMRNAMLSGGGLSAKSYIQDGLIAMWDGIENAGWGVHDPNATVWKDLSGNGYDLEVVAPSAWEPVGIRAVKKIVARSSKVIPYGQHVYGEVCVEDSQGYGAYFWNDTETNSKQKFFVNDKYTSPPHFAIQYGQRCFKYLLYVNGTFQVDWRGVTAKYNNLSIGSETGSYSPGAYSREMVVGGRSIFVGSYGLYCLNALIRAIRIYNRIPSAEEMAHNCAVDKARFNLP